MSAETKFSADDLAQVELYWRAVNYLGAAQVYLRDNFFLHQALKPEDIKNRLLGHWGTVPGINFVYAHLNLLINRSSANVLLLTGPGHGAPANLANLFVEGSLAEYYPELTNTRAGIAKLISMFSMPGGFPSHLYPGTPGCIHEGGELGYALATSFGAALDNRDLLVACIVGDGEAETGPTATAWHCSKFLNPISDGAVLPILHLNGYKISSATIFGSMNDHELTDLFEGYGYQVNIVNAAGESPNERMQSHAAMAKAVFGSYAQITSIKENARNGAPVIRPRWPMIILRSPKGWTCPQQIEGKKIEGSFRAHQVPAINCKKNPEQLKIIENWLRSYNLPEIFDSNDSIRQQVLATCPQAHKRIGMNRHAYGGEIRRDLKLPDFHEHAIQVDVKGERQIADVAELGEYLRDVIRLNEDPNNTARVFRIFCPDEMTSNRLSAVFEASGRQFAWPTDSHDDFMCASGAVMEMLSEHTCQGWLQGYLLTGRHGLFPCYEAFAPIVDSMMNQYAKFLKVSSEIPWRKPVTSLTYLLTSEGWRQDHNGYSHQGPGFINSLLTRKAMHARIYLPPDTNCLLSTIDHCLTSKDKINLVIASKQPMPQWLPIDEAIAHCSAGASIWKWASTFQGVDPDVVLVGAGVYPTAEVLAAAWLLANELPGIRLRVVNVTDLLIIESDTLHPHALSTQEFEQLFTANRSVIFNFHGYPGAVRQLIGARPGSTRFQVNGYIEEGTTTTPFDLLVQNGVSRYQVLIQALRAAAQFNTAIASSADQVIQKYENKLRQHKQYIQIHGVDPAEITDWRWRALN